MATALAYNNSLLRFNNYVIDPGSTPVPPAPVGPSDYKLVLTGNSGEGYTYLRGFNPNVTSGKVGNNITLNQTDLTRINSTDSQYAWNSSTGAISLVIANVNVNTLSFKYRCVSENGDSYTLYRTVDGTDTQISSGTLSFTMEFTDITLNLT